MISRLSRLSFSLSRLLVIYRRRKRREHDAKNANGRRVWFTFVQIDFGRIAELHAFTRSEIWKRINNISQSTRSISCCTFRKYGNTNIVINWWLKLSNMENIKYTILVLYYNIYTIYTNFFLKNGEEFPLFVPRVISCDRNILRIH